MLLRTVFSVFIAILPIIIDELSQLITRGTLTYFQNKQRALPAGRPWNG